MSKATIEVAANGTTQMLDSVSETKTSSLSFNVVILTLLELFPT